MSLLITREKGVDGIQVIRVPAETLQQPVLGRQKSSIHLCFQVWLGLGQTQEDLGTSGAYLRGVSLLRGVDDGEGGSLGDRHG